MSSIEYINSVVLTATAATATFSNIPQNYADLFISCNIRFGAASGSKIRFNSDSGSNYSETSLFNTSVAFSGRASNITSIYNNLNQGDATNTNDFTPYQINLIGYSNSSIFKTILWEWGTGGNLQGSNSEVGVLTGLWRNQSTITSIELSPFNATTYQPGSNFTLWGVR